MALTRRHIGFGKWIVEDNGVKVAGPMKKEDAEAAILSPPTPAAKANRDKEYKARMEADLKKPLDEEMKAIEAVLRERRDEDEVSIILRAIEPVLKAGKQARRRERLYVLPPQQAAAA